MTSALPELEGWIKVAGAAVAVLMAVLVPVRSWIVEDRRFRARTLEAIAAVSRSTLSGVSAMPSSLLADTLALSALAEALNRVAAALERVIEAEGDQDRDRLARALERLARSDGRSGG